MTKENQDYTPFENRPTSFVLPTPGAVDFSPQKISAAIHAVMGELNYKQREAFSDLRATFYKNKFRDVVDRSLPDDEKSYKQLLKEERADAEGYVPEEALLEEYDFLFAFDDAMRDYRLEADEEAEEQRLKQRNVPIRAAFVEYIACVSRLEIGIMMILNHQANQMVKLLKELCPDLDQDTLAKVHRVMCYGQDPFQMIPELKRRMPEVEKEYNSILQTLIAKSGRLPMYARSHYSTHLAPAMALSLAMSQQPYTDELFTKKMLPIVNNSMDSLKDLQLQVEGQYQRSIASSVFGSAVKQRFATPFDMSNKPLG